MINMELKFNATLINEGFVRNSVSSFVMCLNPTVDDIIEIKTIISEAVTNAIIHGYDHDSTKEVVVKACIDDRILTIEVIDQGVGIKDIEEAKVPLFSSLKSIEHAGMGLSIIETLADNFQIISSPRGTQLIITKEFKEHNAS